MITKTTSNTAVKNIINANPLMLTNLNSKLTKKIRYYAIISA